MNHSTKHHLYHSGYLKQRDFWIKKLGDYQPVVRPFGSRKESAGASPVEIVRILPDGLTGRLLKVSKRNETGMYILFLSALYALVHKYYGLEDILVEAPLAGAGCETNDRVPVRVRLDGQETFRGLVTKVKESLLEAYGHEEYPQREVVKLLQQDGFREAHLSDLVCLCQPVHPGKAAASFANQVTFGLERQEEYWRLRIVFDPGRYDEAFLELAADHYLLLLEEVLQAENQLLKNIHFLTPQEKTRMLGEHGPGPAESRPAGVHHLFYEQAQQTPDGVAVEFAGRRVSYRELLGRVRQIAGFLTTSGDCTHRLIGVSGRQSTELVATLLGIMSSGGAYVPIDPAYPDARVRYMVIDSNISLLLTGDEATKKRFEGLCPGLTVVNTTRQVRGTVDAGAPAPALPDTRYAYLIYTSGTTGKPKGVLATHRGVVNTLQFRRAAYGLSPADACLQLFSFAFDGFVTSAFTPLVSGSRLVLLEDVFLKDPAYIAGVLDRAGIQHTIAAPLLFKEVLKHLLPGEAPALRTVVLAGDQLTPELLGLVREKGFGFEVVNEYGVTEASVLTTLHRHVQAARAITIGSPIAGNTLLAIDEFNRPLPVGVAGELAIVGVGVAEGYLNDPALTAERFIATPDLGNRVLYRTGDRGRWLPDGNIELLGRQDNQVSLHGYRIEIGEIETCIRKHPAAEDAIVTLVTTGKSHYLAVYVVTREKGMSLPEVLGPWLGRHLPQYMIPQVFLEIDEIPLNPNGKPDKTKLRGPDLPATESGPAPRTYWEKELAPGWQKMLESAQPVSLTDHFFARGGHSLSAIALATWINDRFGVKTDMMHVFHYPVFGDLAAAVAQLQAAPQSALKKAEAKQYYALSPSQHDLYSAQYLYSGSTDFNISGAIRLNGPVDPARMEQSIRRIIERHESLRTAFIRPAGSGVPVQTIHAAVDFRMHYCEAGKEEVDALLHTLIQPFDLSRAPLLRVYLVRVDAEEAILFLDMHHIIADGVSLEIFIRELIQFYRGEESGPLRYQFKDYLEQQRATLRSESLARQQSYWLEVFDRRVIPLSFDNTPGSKNRFDASGDSYQFSLSPDLSAALMRAAEEAGLTLYMLLFPMFNLLLYRITGQKELIVGTPLSARQQAGLNDVIGLLVNMLPVRTEVDANQPLHKFIEQFKTRLLDTFKHQDYALSAMTTELRRRNRLGWDTPLYNVVFSFDMNLYKFKKSFAGLPGVTVTPYHLKLRNAAYELYLIGVVMDGTVSFAMEYSTRVFSPAAIESIAREFVALLTGFVQDQHAPAGGIAAEDYVASPQEGKYGREDYF